MRKQRVEQRPNSEDRLLEQFRRRRDERRDQTTERTGPVQTPSKKDAQDQDREEHSQAKSKSSADQERPRPMEPLSIVDGHAGCQAGKECEASAANGTVEDASAKDRRSEETIPARIQGCLSDIPTGWPKKNRVEEMPDDNGADRRTPMHVALAQPQNDVPARGRKHEPNPEDPDGRS